MTQIVVNWIVKVGNSEKVKYLHILRYDNAMK